MHSCNLCCTVLHCSATKIMHTHIHTHKHTLIRCFVAGLMPNLSLSFAVFVLL